MFPIHDTSYQNNNVVIPYSAVLLT